MKIRHFPLPRRLDFLPLLAWAFAAAAASQQLRAAPLLIDARLAPPPPAALPFAAGGISPQGERLGANSRFLTRNGQPWFPVMGEFHYSRYPAGEWEAELRKMKAQGVSVVSTYVFWIHHEETPGQFDWTGRRDLRRFVTLCGQCGLEAWVRIGPWAHGEVRNGGFPDWLPKAGARSNDPAYLEQVRQFYGEIGRQLQGLFWKDGGPIVGVQIENEYHPRTEGVEHLQRLLALAQAAGIDAPFYTVTGWDNAAVPASGFLPVFGGYTEEFWSASRTELPPNQNFFFTSIRAEDNVMGDLQPKNPGAGRRYTGFPFLTAEMGGGMAIAYHRRPLMFADDSAAAALVKLGAGIAGLGYYMFHGGTNPDGLTPLEETQAGWNGYNDLEEKSYDFQAPLGEFGQLGSAARPIKTINLFLRDFGSDLAPLAPYFPARQPPGLADRSTPRAAARIAGDHGFVFLNNYERNYPLVTQRDFQVALELPGETLKIPRRPLTVPSGVYTIWPVDLDLGGVTLAYATVQPLVRLDNPDTLVFFAWPGVRAELALRADPQALLLKTAASVSRDGGVTYVTDFTPGTAAILEVLRPGRPNLTILVLARAEALNLWKGSPGKRERLWLSEAGVSFDSDRVHLQSAQGGPLTLGAFPALGGPVAGFRPAGRNGVFEIWAAVGQPARSTAVAARTLAQAAPAQPVKLSRRPVAIAPLEADFAGAAVWSLRLPPGLLEGGARPLLRIDYVGDAARLYAGGRLLDDNFYKGTPFRYGLWRLTPAQLQAGLELRILPLRRDAPIYLPPEAWPQFGANGEALALQRVRLEWDREAVLTVPVPRS
jgi:hypothetical protein